MSALVPAGGAARDDARATLRRHGKTFALASAFLGRRVADDAAVLYAWCRRVDDAVDREKDSARARDALATCRRELEAVLAGRTQSEPLLQALQELLLRRQVPHRYPEELLAGMAMDLEGPCFESEAELSLYCYRAAGVVGLMMCHLFGVRDEAALVPATHLGIAMQLTNIARDVEEDWLLGRRYLPASWFRELGAPTPQPDAARLPDVRERSALAAATLRALALADLHYERSEPGLSLLDRRAAITVRVARDVYAAIGDGVRARGGLPGARVVVPRRRKAILVLRALVHELRSPRPRHPPMLRLPARPLEPNDGLLRL